jgi:cytochrome c oxidase subunit 2
MMTPPPGAAAIAVIGRQWMWEARHPEGARELDELHVPVNRPILLRMTSEDVIHSFAVPAFRVKQDVPPGKTVTTWFEAMQPGRYPIYCDQYCGTKHSAMIGEVVVQTPEDYTHWLSRSSSNSEAARRGQARFVRYGCSGCHVGNAAVRAPRLEGIFGRPVPVEGGKFLVADETYLRDSILLPTQHVAAGYAPVMPSYAGVVTEADLLDLVAYLQSLGTQTPPPPPASPATAPAP